MLKIVVLGGCGAVGSIAVETLSRQEMFDEIVIGDMNREIHCGRRRQVRSLVPDLCGCTRPNHTPSQRPHAGERQGSRLHRNGRVG